MTSVITGILTVVLAQCPQPGVPGPKADEKVKVTVVVILASETGNTIDHRLQSIAEEVRKREQKLKSFKLVSMQTQSLAVDERGSFNLVDSKTVKVVVKQPADPIDKVVLAVEAPEQGEIVYRSKCGKFLPIVTRYQTADRQRLILALRVQPCKGN